MGILFNFLGSKKFVVCAREGGAKTTPYFLAAHFALQNTNPVGAKSEGAAKRSAMREFRLARASRRSEAKTVSSVQKMFEQSCIIAP